MTATPAQLLKRSRPKLTVSRETKGHYHPVVPFSVLEQLLDRPLDAATTARLTEFADWLVTEAQVAGGIGPHEAAKIWERHIYDSAVFARFWTDPPSSCVDLGSGVGLPGIVLAILWPDTAIQLVDRAGRRVRLMRRAIRILGITNVEAVESDIEAVAGGQEAIVMRAALPPPEAQKACVRLLRPGGKAVLGLSRSVEPDARLLQSFDDEPGLTTSVEAVKVLDQAVWMLIMSKS